MKNAAAAAAVNLATLVIGIVIGLLLAQHAPRSVFAQTPQIEEIVPSISSGSAAFGTLLAGRIATDEIAVKGIDLVKLHENTLNLLVSKPMYFTPGEVQAVIDKSKAGKVLRMKEPVKPGEKK